MVRLAPFVLACAACSAAKGQVPDLPRVADAAMLPTTARAFMRIDRDAAATGSLDGSATVANLADGESIGDDPRGRLSKLRGRIKTDWMVSAISEAACSDDQRDDRGAPMSLPGIPKHALLCLVDPSAPATTTVLVAADRTLPATTVTRRLIETAGLGPARLAVTRDGHQIGTLPIELAFGLNFGGAPLQAARQPLPDEVYEITSTTVPKPGSIVWLWVKPGPSYGDLIAALARIAAQNPSSIELTLDDPRPPRLPALELPRIAGGFAPTSVGFVRFDAHGAMFAGQIPAAAHDPKLGITLEALPAGLPAAGVDVAHKMMEDLVLANPPPPPSPSRSPSPSEVSRPAPTPGAPRCGDRARTAPATDAAPPHATACSDFDQDDLYTPLILADRSTPAAVVVATLVPESGLRKVVFAITADGTHASALDLLVGAWVGFGGAPLPRPPRNVVFEAAAVPSQGLANHTIWIWVTPSLTWGELLTALDRARSAQAEGIVLSLEDPR